MTAVIVRVRALTKAEATLVEEIILDDLSGLVDNRDWSIVTAEED